MSPNLIADLLEKRELGEAKKWLDQALKNELDPDVLVGYGKAISALGISAAAALGMTPLKLALLGGYNTALFTPLIRALLFRRGILMESWEGDYGSLELSLHQATEKLSQFHPTIAYFCVGTEHIVENSAREEALRWRSLWQKAQEALHCDVIQNTFEEPMERPLGNFELKSPSSRVRFVRELNLMLSEMAPDYVHFNDVDALAASLGRLNWRDPGYYDQTKIPVSWNHLVTYAQNIVSVISARLGLSKKCLVVDLDETLWGGLVGEVGAAGIEIGPESPSGEAFVRLQSYLKSLRERGVLLAVCSKNEEASAKEPFLKRPEMALRLEDFVSFTANWEPKSNNIRRIAKQLGIALDAIVFLDDSPAERDLVRQELPEVTVLSFDDAVEAWRILVSSGYFETVAVTDEDRSRTRFLKNAVAVQLEDKSSESLESYLKSLKMKAVIAPFDESHRKRITQLMNKTNQFNLTMKRYTESEVASISRDPRYFTRYVMLRDRLGDNGLISAFVARRLCETSYEIEAWLMSCRVFGRGIEHLLFGHVVRSLQDYGARCLRAKYVPAPRNQIVKNFFSELGFTRTDNVEQDVSHWELSLSTMPSLSSTSIHEVAPEIYLTNEI